MASDDVACGGALIDAVLDGDVKRVSSLLRAGVPAGRADVLGTSPLYAASVHGHIEIARLLLDAGADPNAESLGPTDGMPLCAAAAGGFTEVVRELLAHGADPDSRDAGDEMTALLWATTRPCSRFSGRALILTLTIMGALRCCWRQSEGHPSRCEHSWRQVPIRS